VCLLIPFCHIFLLTNGFSSICLIVYRALSSEYKSDTICFFMNFNLHWVGCNTMCFGDNPTFQKKRSPPSLELKNEPSKKTAGSRQMAGCSKTTRGYNPLFQKNRSPPFLGLKNEPSKKTARSRQVAGCPQTTRGYNPKNHTLNSHCHENFKSSLVTIACV
jgi:hypothetical protein